MNFSLDHPHLLWLLLLAVPIVWLAMRSLVAMDRVRRWTAIALRLAVLGVLTLMLAGLQAVQRHTDLTVIAALDRSESVRRFGRVPDSEAEGVEQWQMQFLREAGFDQRAGDHFGLVTYDRRTTVRVPPQLGLNLEIGTVTLPKDGTNTAEMIRAVTAMYPPDSGTRLLISSDFNDTSGDTLAAAREAAAAGIRIDVLPIPYRVDKEVLVEAVHAPTEAREGQTVALRAVLRATRPSTGLMQLLHDGLVLDLNGTQPGTGIPIVERDWTLGEQSSRDGTDTPPTRDTPNASDDTPPATRFLAVKQIDIPITFAGPNKFEVLYEPDAGVDSESTNNRAEAFTLVAGKGRVLFVDGVGGASGNILPRALASHGVELDVRPPEMFPSRMGPLQRYDAVIFQNVSADAVTVPQQKLLAKYVHDLGGGFVMIGGPDSFGAGAWTNSDLDKYILPVSCQIPSQTILPSGALVLVIDRSGSMAAPVLGTNKSQQEVAGESAILALSTLYPQDLVGVVAFDSSAKLIADVQLNSDPGRVAKRIRSIQPKGGTDIYSGLDLAYRKLAPIEAQEAAIKHIILLTDGASQQGNYIKLVGQMNKAGISLSTIGVGDGHNEALLRQLAQMGGGQYHPVANPSNLPKVFIKEAKTIRKNLIKEVPFTPALVSTGSPIMASIDSVPILKGFVLTGQKHDPRIFMPIVGPEGEPVFAHWQVGLGRSAAFTSDATNRWASDWLPWAGYADFWARTIRAIARPPQSREMDLVTTVRGDRLTLRLDATSAQTGDRVSRGGFGNFLNVEGTVMRPDGRSERITLKQVGPGVYEADAPAEAPGNYIVSLFVQRPNGDRNAVFGGASRPPGEELRHFQSNVAMMERVVSITGGRLLDPTAPEAQGLFARNVAFESHSIRPLWRALLAWLLVLFLLDVACRRIAWDLGAIHAWAVARLSAIAGTLQTRDVEQTGATLAALKKTRHRAAVEPAAVPPTQSTRKFEAAEDAEPEADFSNAVGAATKHRAVRPAVAVRSNTKESQAQSTTGRLLDVKRKAREQE